MPVKDSGATTDGPDTVPGGPITPDLLRFTQLATANPQMRFNSLLGLLFREGGLTASFGNLPERKAPGVDGKRKSDYAEDLQGNLQRLSARLRRLGYRPQPVRRVYIPKASGGRRPLGIPSFEDRIVQDRLSRILQAIWEPEFRECSYGYRPGRSAHDALRRIAKVVTHGRTNWVVEADIKGFFDHVHHKHLKRFLEHRIADERFVRMIWRFLKAGVMEDGQFSATEEGTPQGGLVSPILSNIYLHYVLDWWFEGRIRKRCRGQAELIRYADDFVVCFQHRDDAERFVNDLKVRLAKFSLELEPSKTRLLRFGRFAAEDCHQDGRGKPSTFTFLGITHFVSTSRAGRFVVGRKTDSKRMRLHLKKLKGRLRVLRSQPGNAMVVFAQRHLRGYMQYYGVSGNGRSLTNYFRQVSRMLFAWLNRRSQRRSLTFRRYLLLLDAGLLPQPKILHHLYPVPRRKT